MNQYFINFKARAETKNVGLFKPDEYERVKTFFQLRADLQLTPLVRLPNLSSEIGIGELVIKDESNRFGLHSFKILGVSYAVSNLLKEGILRKNSALVCASEGNHGQAVARAARENGLAAIIYLPADVSDARVKTIRREGAQIVITDGTYDEAIRLAAQEAERHGWIVISDTSWQGYEDIPRLIMAGYTRLLDEAKSQWEAFGTDVPNVILVQAGVGALACAVVSWLCHKYGVGRPFTIVCEAAPAACLLRSASAKQPVSLTGPFETMMAGLRCGEASPVAWKTIFESTDAFVAIDDEWCVSAMETLAHPKRADPVISSAAAGACGLAALLAILKDEKLADVRKAAGIGTRSRVLVINTETTTAANRI